MRVSERGFTLIEILFALLIFSIVAVGTLGFLGAASTAGGFLEAVPTSFAGARFARDYTAASVYLQALQEYVARNASSINPNTYVCTAPTCTGAPWSGGAPTPPGQPSQLNWQEVDLLVQLWGWNGATSSYVVNPACAGDCLKLVQATLRWSFKVNDRTLTVQRFVRVTP